MVPSDYSIHATLSFFQYPALRALIITRQAYHSSIETSLRKILNQISAISPNNFQLHPVFSKEANDAKFRMCHTPSLFSVLSRYSLEKLNRRNFSFLS